MDHICTHCGAQLSDVAAGGVVRCRFCGNEAQPEPPSIPGDIPVFDRSPEQEAAQRVLVEQITRETLADIERHEEERRATERQALRWILVGTAIVAFGLTYWIVCFR